MSDPLQVELRVAGSRLKWVCGLSWGLPQEQQALVPAERAMTATFGLIHDDIHSC